MNINKRMHPQTAEEFEENLAREMNDYNHMEGIEAEKEEEIDRKRKKETMKIHQKALNSPGFFPHPRVYIEYWVVSPPIPTTF